MFTLITVASLKALQKSGQKLLVIDARFSLMDKTAGRAAYDKGHVPGAAFLDMEKDLSTAHLPGITGRHPLPEKQNWVQKLEGLGLTPEHQAVVYDDAGGAGASRVWWMLRWAGHARVAVLDGGWQAWLAAGGETSDREFVAAPSGFDYSTLPSLTRLVPATEVDGEKQVLLDAREQARFEGKVEPLDPVAGHIPGAVCVPFTGNLDEEGRFLPVQKLQTRFMEASAPGKDVVCYCGSGVTACHNIMAMVHAGFAEPVLYAGSWSEWITDSARPVATGA